MASTTHGRPEGHVLLEGSPPTPGVDDGAAARSPALDFAEEVVTAGRTVRLPALLAQPPAQALYHLGDRQGIAVSVVASSHLTQHELASLLRFRFAQYLDVGFIDLDQALTHDMRSEPVSVSAPGDLHVVAGVRATGEVLCYAVIEQPPSAAPGCRLRSVARDLFPVEKVHGTGLFDRLPILPDLAVAKVREMGRFVRNQRPSVGHELVTRAVVETSVAIFRLMAGPLRLHVDAVVGDLEEHVAKHNLDFFHIPSVMLHSTVPCVSSASFLYLRYQTHTVHPFACLTSDIETAIPRLCAVEDALAQPGKRGLLALLRLRSTGAARPSMLYQDDGPGPVDELPRMHPQTSMRDRTVLLEHGAWLREVPSFAGLSVGEAALLGSLMQQVDIPAGHVLTAQGEPADAFYIVQSGRATVTLNDVGRPPHRMGALGPGECCGQVVALPNAEHPVTVVASTEMVVLRLTKAVHDRYLSRRPDVGQQLGREALQLLAEVDRCRRSVLSRPTLQDEDCVCGCAPGCAGGSDSTSATTASGGQPAPPSAPTGR